MSTYGRLQKREHRGQAIGVAVVGMGFMGRGIVRQVEICPGMRVRLIVTRRPDSGVQALLAAGCRPNEIVVSDSLRVLQAAMYSGRPAVTTQLSALRDLRGIDCVVEATGTIEYATQASMLAIEGGKHVVMMNAEADATVGCALKRLADDAGVVFTDSDGDQPGVLMRMIEWTRGAGFDPVAAVNCKGFMDIRATPQSVRPWAMKQNTSPLMTTSMADGTKMNVENAVIANATGMMPERRGMHGVKTDLKNALRDCLDAFGDRLHNGGVVDYTLGGDFGGGVFVIGHAEDPAMVQPYLKYLKMGDGPYYLFFRPYHLCHLETPLSIADAVLDDEPTIAPMGDPLVEVVAVAKRDLRAGETLDGIGGYTLYGEVDDINQTEGMLPIGLANGVRLTRDVACDQALPLDAVEIDSDSLLMRLRSDQLPTALAKYRRSA